MGVFGTRYRGGPPFTVKAVPNTDAATDFAATIAVAEETLDLAL